MLSVRNFCVLLLLCFIVVEATSFKEEDAKEVNFQVKPDAAVSADESEGNTTELKPGMSIQLSRGHIHSPEQWQKILRKDKARAQWIAGRLEKAKEKFQAEIDNSEAKTGGV